MSKAASNGYWKGKRTSFLIEGLRDLEGVAGWVYVVWVTLPEEVKGGRNDGSPAVSFLKCII